MGSAVKYVLSRLLAIPVTLFVITVALYGIIMLAPAEERAALYLPPRLPNNITQEMLQARIDQIILEHGLNDPFPQQYARWAGDLLRGDWGWSPTYNADVLTLLKDRTPVTAELAVYALLLFFPLALLSGLLAGWLPGSRLDRSYRFVAFLGTSIPPFILGLFLMSIFYVGLYWFPPGRSGIFGLSSSGFQNYTGFLTIDGLLNGRPDVTLDTARHLVLPVVTLSLLHWATISRVTRVSVIEERNKDYIVSARARGLKRQTIVGRHAFRNALVPALTAGILSAAAIITGVFVVENVFNIKGLSELMTRGFYGAPDAPLTLGFAVYSTLLVLPIMLIFDLLKGSVDPRIRE